MHTNLAHRVASKDIHATFGKPFSDQLALWARRLALAHGAFGRPERGTDGAQAWAAAEGCARDADQVPRRRIAILAGDIVGYSRLIELDDVGTVARLRVLRRELLDPAATMCGATLVRHTADAILLGFDDPADAVVCAITLQSVLFLFNQGLAERQSIRLRIGLSVDEVLFMDGDVHGTGVNIAARLQALAEPGEILLCERAYEQVRSLFPEAFEPFGTRRLHNISMPVPIFRLALGAVSRWLAAGIRPALGQA